MNQIIIIITERIAINNVMFVITITTTNYIRTSLVGDCPHTLWWTSKQQWIIAIHMKYKQKKEQTYSKRTLTWSYLKDIYMHTKIKKKELTTWMEWNDSFCVSHGLRKRCVIMIRIGDSSSDLRPHPANNMFPTPLITGSEQLGFLLIHFKICGKDRLPWEDPGPAPGPPISDRVTNGWEWEGLGSGNKWRPFIISCFCRGVVFEGGCW